MKNSRRKAVVLFGPTASGKTALAIRLARPWQGEIVNADSRQVYCGMPIITAMPTAQEQAAVPHHLFEILPPDADFSVTRWRERAIAAAEDIWQRGGIPFFVGGTGFYLKTLMQGITKLPETDPERVAVLTAEARKKGTAALHTQLQQVDPALAQKLPPSDTQRIVRGLMIYEMTGQPLSELQKQPAEGALDADFLCLGLLPPRDILHQRIENRFLDMQRDGLMDEVKSLLEHGYDFNKPGLKSIGLPVYAAWQRGELTLAEAHASVLAQMRQYAKRQTTWLRHQYPTTVLLTDSNDDANATAAVAQWIKGA